MDVDPIGTDHAVKEEIDGVNNPEDLCRLCANTDNQLIPIFAGDGLELDIHHKIEKYLPIVTVSESDKLPSQICYQCASTLISWHSLYEASILANKRLRELFDGGYKDDVDLGNESEDYERVSELIEFTPVDTSNINEPLSKSAREKRCIARATRKRGPLTTKIGSPDIDEECAKKVKTEDTCPASSAKCENANSSAERVTRNLRERTTRKDTSTPKTRKSNAKPGRPIAPKFETEMQVLLNPDASLLPSTILSSASKSELLKYFSSTTRYSDIENVVLRNFFTCNYCGIQCKRKSAIKRHIIAQHLNPKPRRAPIGPISCTICNRTFKRNYSLRRHVDEVHNKKPGLSTLIIAYCCDFCGQGFEKSPSMFAHRVVVHAVTDPLSWSNFRNSRSRVKSCKRCGKYFKDGDSFLQHVCRTKAENDEVDKCMDAELKSPPVYRCDQCSVCFLWKPLYRQHREDSHPDAAPLDWSQVDKVVIPNYCESCFCAFDEDGGEDEHECIDYDKQVSAKEHPCPVCGNMYAGKTNLLRHVRRMHKPEVKSEDEAVEPFLEKRRTTFECPYCPSSEGTRNSMLRHIQQVHNISAETPFVCVACDQVFRHRNALTTHNQMYHPEKELPEETNRALEEAEILLDGEQAWHCSVCKRNFFDAVRYLAHYRLHNVERKFTCDLCGMRTRTLSHLSSHIRRAHLDIRDYKCDLCSKEFFSRLTCEIHRRTHTGERPFSCEVCGKTFISTSALLMHKKFHNDFYPHPCHMCPKKFKVRTSLVNHIRTHTGERPYKCDLCPKTFNSSSRFSYHKKVTHSENRPFVCTICNTRYKANKFLMKHTKRAHPTPTEGGNVPADSEDIQSEPKSENVEIERTEKSLCKDEPLGEVDEGNLTVHMQEESYEGEMSEQ